MIANHTGHATAFPDLPRTDHRTLPPAGSYAATIAAAVPTREGGFPAYALLLLFRHPKTRQAYAAELAITLHPDFILGVAKLVRAINPDAAGLPIGPDPANLGLVGRACTVVILGGTVYSINGLLAPSGATPPA